MATTNSRVNGWIELLLGYLGLFLIGLLGWACDQFAATRAPGPRRGKAEGAERAEIGRLSAGSAGSGLIAAGGRRKDSGQGQHATMLRK